MTLSDVASIAAVAVSLIALSAQGVSAFRRRRKLVVKLHKGTTTEVEHGMLIEHGYLMVVASALGGAIGVDSVSFEMEPKPDGLSWSGLEGEWVEKLGAVHDPMVSRSAIQEGDTATWHFRIDTDDGAAGYRATAVVRLTNGRRIRSKSLTLAEGEMGWRIMVAVADESKPEG
jgi:hypothetical protein